MESDACLVQPSVHMGSGWCGCRCLPLAVAPSSLSECETAEPPAVLIPTQYCNFDAPSQLQVARPFPSATAAVAAAAAPAASPASSRSATAMPTRQRRRRALLETQGKQLKRRTSSMGSLSWRPLRCRSRCRAACRPPCASIRFVVRSHDESNICALDQMHHYRGCRRSSAEVMAGGRQPVQFRRGASPTVSTPNPYGSDCSCAGDGADSRPRAAILASGHFSKQPFYFRLLQLSMHLHNQTPIYIQL